MNEKFEFEAIKQLNCTELRVYLKLKECMKWHGKHSKSGAEYWNASQAWIAQEIGRTRQWVNRCIQKLHKLGLITSMRRRRVKGRWQTNLYRLGPEIVRILKGAKAAVIALAYHVNCTRHTVLKAVSSCKDIRKEGALRAQLNTSKSDLSEYLASLNRHYPQDGGETA
jgi:biotin operon repressor